MAPEEDVFALLFPCICDQLVDGVRCRRHEFVIGAQRCKLNPLFALQFLSAFSHNSGSGIAKIIRLFRGL